MATDTTVKPKYLRLADKILEDMSPLADMAVNAERIPDKLRHAHALNMRDEAAKIVATINAMLESCKAGQ